MRLALLVCLVLAACERSSETPLPEVAPKARAPRLVILGFDGVDPRRVDAMVQQGKLPNLKALGERGYRGPLRSTNPPQSPVAWATFATGTAPGAHGIFDFVGRNPITYFPEIATTRMRHAEVDAAGQVVPAEAENLRRGEAFWDVISAAGISTLAIRVPYNFPLPASGATALAGLGAPDVRGINSSFTLLTTDAAKVSGPPPAGGQVAALSALGEGRFRAMLEGPSIKVDGQREKTYAQLMVQAVGAKLALEIAGVSQTLAVGETSQYVALSFTPGPALTVRAVTRFTVRTAGIAPEIYVEPMSLAADEAYLPVAQPLAFGQELWRRFGPFKTVGWIEDTSGLGASVLDESQFVREALSTMRWEEQTLKWALGERQDRVVISVFTSPDRIGHMFYRYLDPRHPARAGESQERLAEFAQALEQAYLEMDRIVGTVQAALASDDTLLVMSDHGFASFRRGLNLNTWLKQKGFLKLKPGVKTPRDFFADVDWPNTKAYALGTGSIYLNLEGREAQGSVTALEAPKVAAAIAKGLLTIRDGGAPVVLAAYLGDEVYQGPARAGAPDVRVAVADGYRASWATSLGGIPPELFEVNTKKWSGDHASQRPEDVPGILVSSKPLGVTDPGLEDLSATVFRFTGVKAPVGNAGRPLF